MIGQLSLFGNRPRHAIPAGERFSAGNTSSTVPVFCITIGALGIVGGVSYVSNGNSLVGAGLVVGLAIAAALAQSGPIHFAALPGGQLRTALPPVLKQLRGDFGLRASSTPLDRLHVSVLGVGIAHQMPADNLAAAIAVTNAITVTPFQLWFTSVMSYRRSGGQAARLVLIPDRGATQVAELAAQLAQAMIDQAVDPRGALDAGPHMTLLYDRARVPPTPLSVPIVVTIESVALIHSHWGKGRYSILAETPVKTAA